MGKIQIYISISLCPRASMISSHVSPLKYFVRLETGVVDIAEVGFAQVNFADVDSAEADFAEAGFAEGDVTEVDFAGCAESWLPSCARKHG